MARARRNLRAVNKTETVAVHEKGPLCTEKNWEMGEATQSPPFVSPFFKYRKGLDLPVSWIVLGREQRDVQLGEWLLDGETRTRRWVYHEWYLASTEYIPDIYRFISFQFYDEPQHEDDGILIVYMSGWNVSYWGSW